MHAGSFLKRFKTKKEADRVFLKKIKPSPENLPAPGQKMNQVEYVNYIDVKDLLD